jgi:hypothetical protein
MRPLNTQDEPEPNLTYVGRTAQNAREGRAIAVIKIDPDSYVM